MSKKHLEVAPIKFNFSPHYIECKKEVENWASTVCLTSDDGSVEETVHWSSIFYCFAQSTYENLVIIAKWNYWFTFANDFVSNLLAFETLTDHVLKNILDLWASVMQNNGYVDKGNVERTFLDIPLLNLWETTTSITSESWQKRFIKNFKKYWKEKVRQEKFSGTEKVVFEEGQVSLDKCSKDSLSKAQFRLEFLFGELAAGLKLQPSLADDMLFKSFVQNAVFIMSTIRDIYTYSLDTNNAQNLVLVLQKQRKCTNKRAIEQVSRLQKTAFDRMNALVRQYMANDHYDGQSKTFFVNYTDQLMFYIYQAANLLQIGDFKY